MKCLENRAAIPAIHEALEDGMGFLSVFDNDAYLHASFDNIGFDYKNVSVYGISIKDAIDDYIESYCYTDFDGSLVVMGDEQEIKTLINIFKEQLKKLKSINVIEGVE
jgi:hypothetical protein